MRESRSRMGMTVTVEIADMTATQRILDEVFHYFESVDKQFSTYKDTSEISHINRGEITPSKFSDEMKEVFALAEKTHIESHGFFDIHTPKGTYDPSGVVKGWAINNAAHLIASCGYKNFFIDAGGDIQSSEHTAEGKPWSVGIKNPFNAQEIVKVIYPKGKGVATSGTYIRGQHIYNPHAPQSPLEDVVSLTVVGGNVCDADRYATAAFAMGTQGIHFIEELRGFEGYAIDKHAIATMTRGFESFLTA